MRRRRRELPRPGGGPASRHLASWLAAGCLAGEGPAAAAAAGWGHYERTQDYMQDFFANFAFWTAPDPTHGLTDYIGPYDEAVREGLVKKVPGGIYMGPGLEPVLRQGSRGRRSIRVQSKAVYNRGLFVVDVAHIPMGCGAWPAFWMYGEDSNHIWPAWGELDIIEGVHLGARAATTLHTGPDCNQTSLVEGGAFTGRWSRSTPSGKPASVCDVEAPGQYHNQGCAIVAPENTMGASFNQDGGGVFATEWDPEGEQVRVWFWPRGLVPPDLAANKPNPESWGTPYAFFSLAEHICPARRLQNMRLVFDTTFCGDLGSPTFSSQCKFSKPEAAGVAPAVQDRPLLTCEEFVRTRGDALAEAYWVVRGLDVYQRAAGTAPPPKPAPTPLTAAPQAIPVPPSPPVVATTTTPPTTSTAPASTTTRERPPTSSPAPAAVVVPTWLPITTPASTTTAVWTTTTLPTTTTAPVYVPPPPFFPPAPAPAQPATTAALTTTTSTATAAVDRIHVIFVPEDPETHIVLNWKGATNVLVASIMAFGLFITMWALKAPAREAVSQKMELAQDTSANPLLPKREAAGEPYIPIRSVSPVLQGPAAQKAGGGPREAAPGSRRGAPGAAQGKNGGGVRDMIVEHPGQVPQAHPDPDIEAPKREARPNSRGWSPQPLRSPSSRSSAGRSPTANQEASAAAPGRVPNRGPAAVAPAPPATPGASPGPRGVHRMLRGPQQHSQASRAPGWHSSVPPQPVTAAQLQPPRSPREHALTFTDEGRSTPSAAPRTACARSGRSQVRSTYAG